MGNINEIRQATYAEFENFLLPMGNINRNASAGRTGLAPLSTPYGKHKHVLADPRKYNYISFYSLWET